MERIATGGVGSKRYRVTFNGPGGHSYGAFGLVNPMYAMADAIARLGRVKVPARPKTTYSASVTGGGTSINSIPNSVWTEFDLRSEAPEELDRLERAFLELVRDAVAAENAARSTRNGVVTADLVKIGDRPAGHTDEVVRTGAAGAGGVGSARVCAEVRGVIDRCQHPDEPGNSGDQDRLRWDRRARAFAGGVDRRRTRGERARDDGRACNATGRGGGGIGPCDFRSAIKRSIATALRSGSRRMCCGCARVVTVLVS